MNDNEVKKLYNALVSKGYSTNDLGDDATFSSKMADKNSRKELYDYVSSKGNFRIGDFDSYENRLSSSATPKTAEQPATTAQPEAAVPVEQAETRWKPTEQEKIRMSAQTQNIINSSKRSMADLNEHIDNMQEYGINLGSTTKKSKKMFNAESGQMEDTYLTPAGNRYNNKALADAESFRFRQAADMSVSGQLRKAQERREEIAKRLAERGKQLDAQAHNPSWADMPRGSGGGVHTYNSSTNNGRLTDGEYAKLNAALRQVDQQISTLTDEKDRQNGVDVGFWRGIVKTMGDVRTWDFGTGDIMDATAMLTYDKNFTDKEREASELMMGEIANKQQVDSEYGNNASFWNRAGVVTGYMPSFMFDFVLTCGGYGGINVLGKVGAKTATKVVGKEVVEVIAKQGFKSFVKNNGVKGFGQAATNWTIKALGTSADDLLLRAPLMTNTIQAGKTSADIIDRKLGDVVVDDNGEYKFSNDKTWGDAVWQGEANSIIENYSEMFGAHLDPVLSLSNMGKLANTIGAKRLGGVLAKADAGALNGIMGATNKMFEKMGVSDYVGEVSEEYYGQLWRTMLNLDDAYQQNPDGTRTNLFETGQFHGDIWGGMALSMGLMGAGKHTLNAANYTSMKHGVNKADKAASETLGTEVWEPMKEIIDLTTNENVGDVADLIVNNTDFTDDEKSFVLNYMERSLNLRGFNLGSMAKSRGGEQNEDEQQANESYLDGYNATSSQEMNDAKNMYDYQREQMKRIVGTNEEALEGDVIDWLNEARNSDTGSERQQTILDYINAKQVYDGMVQRVRDDIDGRIDQSNAMISAHTNHDSGKIQGATMKQDDRKVYVVRGNLVPYLDNTGIDIAESDESIIIRDAETGALEQVSPDTILSIDDEQDPYEQQEIAAQAIREQFAREAADKIDGTASFNLGDTYTITGEDGSQSQVQIVANKDGNFDNGDGTVNVSSNGSDIFPLPKEVIQQSVDAANISRVAKFEQQRAEENLAKQQAQQEASRPQYAMNDTVTLRDDNGNSVRGSITADADADGRYEVFTEDAINGKRVNLFTRDELDGMLAEHNGETIEEPVQETAEIVPELTENVTEPAERIPNLTENVSATAEGVPEITESVQTEQQQASATDRIPKDDKGNPLYEQAETPEIAWDSIVEQTEGDEAMAQTVADGMVADKEAALKKIEKAKSKGGETIAEKIAAEKERKAAIEEANNQLAMWKRIAQTSQLRKMAEQSERNRIASEKAAELKAEQDKLRAEKEEAERIEREALGGVPDMVDDTPQNARARGYRRVSGHKVDRQQPLQSLQGKEVSVKFGNDALSKGRVAVIDATELQPSHLQGVRNPAHFIDEAQPKERNDEASVLSARKIASNMRPEEITSSVTAYTGAPTVNTRGEVIQGNNRSDALREMWNGHKEQSDKYKQYLKYHSDEFGLSADNIDRMDHPVLVNMLDVADDEAIKLGQYVAQDTESGGTERIKPKNALQKMSNDIRSFANLLLKSADDEISFAGLVDNNGADVLKWMNQKGHITPTQYKSAFDTKGNLTAEAKNDLKGILYQSIFKGGSIRLEEMFNAMPAKAQRAILATAYRDYDSPNAERMVGEIQNSIRAYNALSANAQFVDAKTFKEARLAVEAWKRQYQMDDVTGEGYLPAENFSNFALHLASMYKGDNQNFIQNTFNQMYDLIQGTQEENLFEKPDNTPRSLAQAIYETLKIDYNGQQRSNVLVGDSPTSQQGEQGSDGSLATGERVEDGNESANNSGGTESGSGQSEITSNTKNDAKQRGETTIERTDDSGVEATTDNSGRVADDTTRSVEGDRNRGDIRVFEEGLGTSYGEHSEYSERNRREAESERLVNVAKRNDQFISESKTKQLGKKYPKQTGESTVYIDKENGKVYKVKDPYAKAALKKGVQPEDVIYEHTIHNLLFPETEYTFEGISEDLGDARIVLSQDLIQSVGQPTKEQIAEALAKKGLYPEDNYSFGNELVSVTDVEGDNVLLGEDGTIYFIDPIIKFKRPAKEIIESLSNSQQETLGNKLEAAEAETNTTPTDAQKEAGNYKKGHVQVGTFDITIENPKGSERSGTDANGKKWSIAMQNTYGYIRGTEGVDGDHIDVFLSDDIDGWNGGKVFVVDQYNEDGTFDEHKVMLGFNDAEEAEGAYYANYSSDWKDKHPANKVTAVNIEDFEKWIASSYRKTKAFAEYKNVKSTPASIDNYTVEPAKYTTKRGKVLDMQLVKFGRELAKEEQRNAISLAKSLKGWYDREQGGFMMRSAEDAQQIVDAIMEESGEILADAAPISLQEIQKATEVTPKKINVEGVFDSLNSKGEAKLSEHEEDIFQKAERIAKEQEQTKQKNEGALGLVSDERMAELKERLRKKLGGQLNVGIDPEILSIGMELAAGHIDRGVNKFADFAKVMVDDLGDVIRPYLKAFYNAARDLPEIMDNGLSAELTPYDEVRTFDVANFDKEHSDPFATAETIVAEQEKQKQAEEAKKGLIEKRNTERKSSKEKTVSSEQANLFEDETITKNTEDNGRKVQELSETIGEQREDDSRDGIERQNRRGSDGIQERESVRTRRTDERRLDESLQERRNDGRGNKGIQGGEGEILEGTGRSFRRLSGLKNTNNNHSERGENHAPISVDARIEANIKAIELAQQLLESGEKATPEQMSVLRKFSGWGGLGKAFNENETRKKLQELLGSEAYGQAVMSANSAYYTPAYVVDTLWDVAEQMGFKGGNILEGSAGIGNVLGQMPTNVSENSNIQAIEIDGTSGGILSLLYPDAKVDIQGFEQTRIPNGSVDLAITNVPFVTGLRVNDTTGDSDLSKKFHNIHDFCIAKNIRKLREGGIGIFITSNGTLDNSKKLRDWITNEGCSDFVGAFRMNNKTFGGTGVTSDIIVIRKRVNARKSANAIDVSDISGERSAEYDTGETRKIKGQEVPVTKQLSMDYNKYFIEHPENMAGEMHFAFEQGDTFRPTSKGLYPTKEKNQEQMLANFVKSFKEEEFSDKGSNTDVAEVMPDKKIGELFERDGKLYVNSTASSQPISVNDNKVKGHTKVECFNAYTAIKQALNDVLSYQTENDSDNGLKPLLAKLNKAYDSFVDTYGHFNKNTAISFLRNDVDYANVSSVETYEEKGDGKGGTKQTFGKADVMKARVVEKEKEPTPTNVKDGIVASMFKFGRIDVPYIASQIGESQQNVKSKIISDKLGFEDPATKQMELSFQYLSGNVREKLRQAQENNENGEYNGNIKELQDIIPIDIPAHLIDFTLGSSWIDPKLYNDYVKERTDIDVNFTSAGGTWHMDSPEWGLNKEKNRSMGVFSEKFHKQIMGHILIEAAIQNKSITVSETKKKWDGTTETITDKEATQACAAKIDEIRQDFKEFARQRMQSDPDMSVQMERIYNDTFNNYVPPSVNDEFIPKHFPYASRKITLEPHQSRAVMRGLYQPLLLAHEVGAGKTFTLISTAMEMRRLGTARKPMIVVQNATVGQFVASAKELYPNAKILTLEDSDRTAEGRKNFYAKIRYNDWDMIVVPQSTFEFIPDSEERQMAFVQDKIEEKMIVLEKMKEADPKGKNIITRQAEKEIADLEVQLAEISNGASKKRTASDQKKEEVTKQNAEVKALEMLDRRTDDVENFDDMGIDALLIDEAHEYKHLGFATAMQRGVKGVDASYSKKSQGVYLKTQAVIEKNNGRNVIFATGTPISNTAAEIWTFMRYLMPADTMKEYGIYYFDDFVRNFGNIQQMVEFTTSGKFKENNRFAGYVNLPELVRIWSSVSDTMTTKEIEEQRKVSGNPSKIPDIDGGKAHDIYLPQTKSLRSIMKYVKAQLEEYEKMSGKEKKENSHIPLTMYGIAKAAAIDCRLVDADAEDEPNSKTNEAVRQTLRSLKDTKSYKGTVAIFADNYQNSHSGFNLYDDIRTKLIADGIPADEVVVIKSGMSVKKKLEIFDKVNKGEIRVVMGSTFTLGTGVNIQERLHTVIHLDAPNRPMDYTQRNGRILRQGNLHKSMDKPVRVLRFGVEDSLDVTAYQRLKTKGAIADSIMNGKQMMQNSMVNRVLEEEEDVFGDTVAQLSGSEYAMLKNNAEKNVRKYESRKKQWEADQTYIYNAKPKLKGQIATAEYRAGEQRKYLQELKEAFADGKYKELTVGKQSFATVDDMADFIKEYNKKVLDGIKEMKDNGTNGEQKRELTVSVGGYDFNIKTVMSKEINRDGGQLFSEVHRVMTYSCDKLGLTDVPVYKALLRNALVDITENVITGKDFTERAEAAEKSVKYNQSELEQLLSRDGKPFEYDKELEQSRKQYTEYAELMKKEMEEKEVKYAEMDKTVEASKELDSLEDDDDVLMRDDELAEINDTFNEELQEQIDGKLPKGHVYDLGMPSNVLLSAGIPNLPIEMASARLLHKSNQDNHPFELSEIRDLPRAIQNPLAVFMSATHIGSNVILTELKQNSKNFVVAIETNRERGKILVNSIRSIHPRTTSNIVSWINDNLMDYADKQNLQVWIGDKIKLREYLNSSNPADVRNSLNSAANIVKEFENPTLSEINSYREGESLTTNDKSSVRPRVLRKQMTERVKELIDKLSLDNVEIVSDASNLDGKKRKAKGFYTKSTGKITIVIGNNTSIADVEKTLLHEAVAHHGLRKLFGEHFDTFLDNVFNNADESVRKNIVELSAKNGWDFRKATEEYLAGLAETTNFEEAKKSGWWNKIKSLFGELLQKLGFADYNGIITDNELRYVLWRSYENLKDNKYNNLLSEAADVAKQYELGVGESSNTQDDTLLRDGDPEVHERALARDRYEQRVRSGMYQSQEAMQDSMLGLEAAMKAILGKEWKYVENVADFENAYLGENRLSSINQDEVKCMNKLLFKPMLDEVAKLSHNEAEREELTDYMMAKHGLERNRGMAERDAQKDYDENMRQHPNSKKTLQDYIDEYRGRDYAGLTALTGMGEVAEAETETQQIVDDYESNHNTDELWNKVNAVNKATLSKSYECGMMNKETFDKVSDMYEYYIPLRGFDEKTSSEAYAYLNDKHSAFNAPIKKAKGRKSKADDPFANMQSMAESAIMQGNRNKLVKQRFLNFALNHPSDLVSVSDLWLQYDAVSDEWEPVFPDNIDINDTPEDVEKKMSDFEEKMKQLADADPDQYKHGKDTLNIPYRVVEKSDLRQHQVVVKRGGMGYVITINGNPRAAQALNGQTNPDNDISGSIGSILSAVGKVNRTLSALYTTLQPDFISSNFMRDMIFANIMAWIKESPRYALRFNRNCAGLNVVTMKMLIAKYRKGTLDMNDPKQKMFSQFMKNGGETGYSAMLDIDGHKKAIKKVLKRINSKVPASEAMEAASEWVGEVGRAVEMQARFAAFMTSRHFGRDMGRSIYDAKEISVNFNKKGAGDKFLKEKGMTKLGQSAAFISGAGRANYVFWNAAIQGTFGNFIKNGKRHPVKSLAAVATFYALGQLVAALGASGGDDDDDYYDLPETTRRNNICIKGPGKSWIKIPLPIEFRAVYGMGELCGTTIYHNEPLSAHDILAQFTQLTPIDIMAGQTEDNFSWKRPFVPSSVKPMVEVGNNIGWTGLPIWKDTPYNKNMPEWTKAYKNSNKILVNFAATINELSGGDNYKKGYFDPNPAAIEYLLRGYAGGFWTMTDQLIKIGETAFGKREFDWRYVPLVNRMITNGDERTEYRAVNNEYFRLKEEHDQIKSRLKHYEDDTDNGVFDYAEKIDFLYNSPEYERYEIFEDYRKDIDALYEEMKEVVDDEDRKQIDLELNELKKEMIDEMNQTRKRK